MNDNHSIIRNTSRGPIVSAHPSVHDMLSVLDRVASSSCTVLVTGESGTGKELAVAALHDASPRRSERLVAVNCGAIPENLVESELFGHARGAFTGAVHARQGHVAAAEGGTLFLDEIGELSPAVQVKLLRLLQRREYTPVGESRVIACDVRIVAATHRDLERDVAEGRFREDLYYRLNVIHVQVPALRHRRSDIPLLAAHFLRDSAVRSHRADVTGFTPAAVARLASEEWAGNIRAFENTIERAVLLARGGLIDVIDLGLGHQPMLHVVEGGYEEPAATPIPEPRESSIMQSEGAIDLRAAVEAYENELIKSALTKTKNNKSKAAQLLGLQRTTFVEMLKRKGIDAPLAAPVIALKAA